MLDPKNVKSIADARAIIEQRGITHVKVGLFDTDGVMRGKYMSSHKFLSSLEHGFAFCDVTLGWDSNDQLYENKNVTFTGWHTGYPDAPVRVIPESCRQIPFEPETLLFLCEFDGRASELCPRNLLKRIIQKASKMGFEPFAAFEYEFFLFNETPLSAREKRYNNLQPFTQGNFGYSMIRNSVHSDIYEELFALSNSMDFPIEGLHTETGPGVLEAALAVDTAVSAADKAALFKTYIKVWAQRIGKMATFMAKWSNKFPGQSGHIHMSLRHKDGRSAFYDPKQPHNMSDLQRHFVAGLQKLMPEFLSMLAQTVNSYSRLVPGFWAPTASTWGCENRTTALRVIPGSDKAQRVEFRLGSADANPYIALAATLAAGLYGIEKKLEPSLEVKGNAYEQKHPDHLALPQTLAEAARALRSSAAAKSLFGEQFVNHFSASREWEFSEFCRHVTDWERSRYFEII
ncbi:glutamine synthetase family protein [Microbulbifer agarilyticus]|uniref:glutamine synthetase family protein n=1 Tax=Microbulbifer agarilyticus TaxID=260552 RepID=UPI001CD3BD0C|nr:glutamine synthetase family protein [Microbulbifer agarilyticus]MCA0899538.1 glutamine synthetase family protein [Microbulbifer agarilyticus]